jgi:ABC-type transport system substrate-binding protein
MKYNPETKNFEKDLATCDIKNLKNIECYVDSGEKWSDDSEITIDDVYKTYSRLKELESEQTIYPFLKDISLSKTENKIVFSSENSDINHIKILLQYIVPGDIVESMTRAEISGTISNPAKFLYSGPYTISDITNDETTGIRSVILVRNKKFTDRSYHIDKISFRFFKTPSDILKYKSMINVFNDTENIL